MCLRVFTPFALFLTAVLAPAISPAQALPDRAAPASAARPHAPSGFIAYTLGKLNPQDRDYGSSLARFQSEVAARTIDDLYFWSNCVSLTLLAGVTGLFLLQLRAAEKQERICSELIAQLWNGRVSDGVEIERRTATHNQLVDKHNALLEQAAATDTTVRFRKPAGEGEFRETPRVEMSPVKEPASSAISNENSVRVVAEPTAVVPEPAVPAAAESAAEPATAAIPEIEIVPAKSPQEPARERELSPDQETRRLRAQVEALTNVEKNLKKRLNDQQEYISSMEKSREQNSGKKTQGVIA